MSDYFKIGEKVVINHKSDVGKIYEVVGLGYKNVIVKEIDGDVTVTASRTFVHKLKK